VKSVTNASLTISRPPTALIFRSLFRADFTVFLRSFRALLINILIPIFILVITNLNDGSAPRTGLGSPGFDIALALTYGLMASSLIGYSITVARDRDAGVFQRLRVTPAPTWAIMSSRLLVQVVVNLVMTVVVVAIGTIIHHLSYSVGQYLLLGCASLIGGAMFLAIGQAVVGLVRSATVVNAVGRVLYVVLLLLGLLGSSGLLGDTVKVIAQWSPVGAMITVYAGVLDISAWAWLDTEALIASLAYIAVGAFVGIRWFRWDSR
jgi:ABC-2 type transport system permease protein